MMTNRLLSVFLALAAVACVVDGVPDGLDEGPYCDIPGWCGDGTKEGCESQAFDLTPKETIEILKNAVPLPGGSVEKTTKSTSIKTSVYTGEVVVGNGNPSVLRVGTTTTTCSSSCTGNGCSITGCDASWSGCDSCSCFGSSCSACTCSKTSTYTESRAAPGGGTGSGIGPPVRRGV